MDEALVLARVQFGLNIAFHILFPSLTIGLAWALVFFRLRYAATGDLAVVRRSDEVLAADRIEIEIR